MRVPLLCLCLGLCLDIGLMAGEAPRPGLDPAFLARVQADTDGGRHPWKSLKQPADSASATVEIIGELSPEELKQVTFQEFMVWFQADLRKFWRAHGFQGPPEDDAVTTRAGGQRVSHNVALARVNF